MSESRDGGVGEGEREREKKEDVVPCRSGDWGGDGRASCLVLFLGVLQ